MRYDKRLDRLTVTPRQRYFLSCWFNMVHEFSLDAFRVRVMNPFTTLRELHQAMNLSEAKPEEKAMIFEESEQLLKADKILSQPPFNNATQHILNLLSGDKAKIASEKGGPRFRMLGYLINELSQILDDKYIIASFSELKSLLNPAEDGSENFKTIHSITGSLLSSLLDREFPLESLYQIYSQVLTRKIREDYSFERDFDLAIRILTKSKSKYDISFALDLVTKPEELPPILGKLLITEEPPFKLAQKNVNNTYLDPKPRRRFITVKEIEALDVRTAGRVAYEKIINVVNLLRFEYEKAPLQISEIFAIRPSEATHGARIYPIPRVVPNPTLTLNGNDVAAFIDSVNELVEGSNLGQEALDRIVSSFRLYRQGRDQEAIETKLTHWWTALEYLVRGNQASGGIGKSIENAVAPVIGLSYVPKLLIAIRNLLSTMNSDLVNKNGDNLAKLSKTRDLWEAFKNSSIQEKIIDELSNDYFLREQAKYFFDDISEPKKLHARLSKHDDRVRWQIQRLWRTRCDIVHSAGRGANHLLLCSNLEFYLKTSLNSFLSMLRSVPTLSGPHEYFDRQQSIYEKMMKSLEKGHDDIASTCID